MKSLLLSLFLVVSTTISSHAELIGYWDFNNSLARSSGSSGTLSVLFVGVDVGGVQDYGDGTNVNLVAGFSEGQSLRFSSLASIVDTEQITVSGLDLTNRHGVVVSFAVRNDDLFIAGESFTLEYNTGSGWQPAVTFADPGDDFATEFHSFLPGQINGAPSAAIRISHHTVGSALDVFEIDNLQITAIPEPASWALMTAGLLMVAAVLRRRARGYFNVT